MRKYYIYFIDIQQSYNNHSTQQVVSRVNIGSVHKFIIYNILQI